MSFSNSSGVAYWYSPLCLRGWRWQKAGRQANHNLCRSRKSRCTGPLRGESYCRCRSTWQQTRGCCRIMPLHSYLLATANTVTVITHEQEKRSMLQHIITKPTHRTDTCPVLKKGNTQKLLTYYYSMPRTLCLHRHLRHVKCCRSY